MQLSPLGSSFQELNVRVECSPLSSKAGMECLSKIGCICIRGILDHFIGVQDTYAGMDFFEMDLRQSICSYRLEYGEELRWIAPMAHWVYFVQPYKVDGWNYVTRLIDFVDGGMVDSDFVNLVGALSVLGGAEATLDSSTKVSATEKLSHNFFKLMRMLSEGMTQANHFEFTTARPTTSPSSIVHPQSLLSIMVPGSGSPTNPSAATSSSSTSSPVLSINNPVTPVDPLHLSSRDMDDPIATANIETVNDAVTFGSDKISPPKTSSKPTQPQVFPSDPPSSPPTNVVPPWLYEDEILYKDATSEGWIGKTSKSSNYKTLIVSIAVTIYTSLFVYIMTR